MINTSYWSFSSFLPGDRSYDPAFLPSWENFLFVFFWSLPRFFLTGVLISVLTLYIFIFMHTCELSYPCGTLNIFLMNLMALATSSFNMAFCVSFGLAILASVPWISVRCQWKLRWACFHNRSPILLFFIGIKSCSCFLACFNSCSRVPGLLCVWWVLLKLKLNCS
jgi:membrane-associated HD superfamily phosphohydrolase